MLSSSENGFVSAITIGDRRSENRSRHRIVFPVGKSGFLDFVGFFMLSLGFLGIFFGAWDFSGAAAVV